MFLSFSSFNWRCWDSFAFLASLQKHSCFHPLDQSWLSLSSSYPVAPSPQTQSHFVASSHLLLSPSRWITVYFFLFSFSFLPIISTPREKSRHPRRLGCPPAAVLCYVPWCTSSLYFPQFYLLFTGVTGSVPLMRLWDWEAIWANIWHMTILCICGMNTFINDWFDLTAGLNND